MKELNLTDFQRDVLREIGNIGAGNVTTSIAQLINKRIQMEVPSVDIVTFDELANLVGGPEELIVGLFFRFDGEVKGSVYLVFTLDVAQYLIAQLTGDKHFNLLKDSHEYYISALTEIGNMMTGSYLTALSDLLYMNLHPTIPYLSVDMAGAVLTEGILHLSNISDYAIAINTFIYEDGLINENNPTTNDQLKVYFFLLPDYEFFPKIFSKLGIAYE